jgi:hypothetical protein
MQKTIHKTKDKNHARRLTAMLMLHRGDTVSYVARTLCCARSSIGRWINWFTLSGVEGLKSLPSGRGRRWPFVTTGLSCSSGAAGTSEKIRPGTAGKGLLRCPAL